MPSFATILLVVWSANGDGSAQLLPRWDSVTIVIFQTNRARYALNMEILNILNEESISKVRSGRASLQLRREVYRECLKRWVDR